MIHISNLLLQRLYALYPQKITFAISALLILACAVDARAGEKSEKSVNPMAFHASPVDNRFVLTDWNISNSNAQELYTIERSIDGIHYETAGYVRGEFSHAPVINYSFIDENPYNGFSYYRVKITHSDKQVTFTPAVSVRISKLQFHVFPNPAARNGAVSLNIQDIKAQEIVLQLFDMSGARVMNKVMQLGDGHNGLQFSLDGISAGAYTLTLSSETFFEKHTLTVQ